MTTITLRSQRRRLMNQAMDAYAGWRDQCGTVERAYRHWTSARGRDAAAWYTAYAAALDREERAAERYARLVRRLTAPGEVEPVKAIASAAGSW
jgi:hypothetical protein